MQPIDVFGDETISKSYGNRTVVEHVRVNKFTGNKYWYYTVEDLILKSDSLKSIKEDVMDITKYPLWSNPLRIRNEFRLHSKLALKCFEKVGSTNQIRQSIDVIDILLDDSGSSLCYKIYAKNSLFEIFTAKELLDVFDKIGTFKYTKPIFRTPDKGYTVFELRWVQ